MCLSALGVGPGGSGSSAAAVPIAPDVAASGWWGGVPVAAVAQPLAPVVQAMEQPILMGTPVEVQAVQPMVMEPVSFLAVTEHDEVWNDRGSRAQQDVSV